jgi:PIN domain nuclease of toxin-antitoxin system
VARYLIDSHIFLWAAETPGKLSAGEKTIIADPREDVVVSAASVWELSVKWSIGRLEGARPRAGKNHDHFAVAAKEMGIPILPIEAPEAEFVRQLPHLHRDPFDRLILAQALLGGRVIVTRDRIFARYPGVRVFEPGQI